MLTTICTVTVIWLIFSYVAALVILSNEATTPTPSEWFGGLFLLIVAPVWIPFRIIPKAKKILKGLLLLLCCLLIGCGEGPATPQQLYSTTVIAFDGTEYEAQGTVHYYQGGSACYFTTTSGKRVVLAAPWRIEDTPIQ